MAVQNESKAARDKALLDAANAMKKAGLGGLGRISMRPVLEDVWNLAYSAAIEDAARKLEELADADIPSDRQIGFTTGAAAIRSLKGDL